MNNERNPLRDVLATDLPDAAEKETAKSYAEQAQAAAKRAEDAASTAATDAVNALDFEMDGGYLYLVKNGGDGV